MAEKENELTPEEKLLKVIQDGDEKTVDETSAVSPAEETVSELAPESATEVSTAAPEPVAAGKSELKLAKTGTEEESGQDEQKAPADDSVAVAKPAKEPSAGKPAARAGVIEAGPVVGGLPGKSTHFGISTVNRCLAAVVLIMIGFAVYEIWASIQIPRKDAPDIIAVPELGWVNTVSEQAEIPIEDVLKAFEKKQIIGIQQTVKKTNQTVKQRVVTPIEVYARENLKLIGLSDNEAIVVDRKMDKMFFLKEGDKIKIAESEVDLIEITSEYVKIAEGDREITIK